MSRFEGRNVPGPLYYDVDDMTIDTMRTSPSRRGRVINLVYITMSIV